MSEEDRLFGEGSFGAETYMKRSQHGRPGGTMMQADGSANTNAKRASGMETE